MLAGELVFPGDHVGELAHWAALVGVRQAVKRHMVFGVHSAVFVALADIQQVRGIGHGFHAAGDHDIGVACEDGVAAHDGGLHAGATHLVDRRGFEALVLARFETGLTGRGLALARGKAVAHDDFVRFAWRQFRFADGLFDGDGAQFAGCQAGKVAEQATHGRAAHTDDDDGILFRHGVSFR